MNDWIRRHLLLTREERLIAAAVILIAITGLGVKLFLAHHDDEPPALEQQP